MKTRINTRHLMGSLFLLCLISVSTVLTSCDDYVDIVPKGNTIPQTVDDLGEMLSNGSGLSDLNFNIMFLDVMSDDYTAPKDPQNVYYMVFQMLPFVKNQMEWADYIWAASEDDMNWNGLYKSNYVCNYVLDHIADAKEGISFKRDEVKGQALVHRAMNYFLLGNLYGKQYKVTSADKDLSVPLVLESNINKQYPRATVKEVYDQMIADLTEAVSLLKTPVTKFNNIPGLAAAYAIRARYYLWMQDYDNAYADASKALTMKSEILDYNTLSPIMPGIPAYGVNGYDSNLQTNPEILYSRFLTETLGSVFSDKMQAIIDKENDLRYKIFIGDFAMSGITEPMIWTRKHHSGIDVAEVWLIKAEAAARKSSPNLSEANQALEYVRKHRYAAAAYQPYNISDRKQLVEEILRERRREIMYTEMNFLDNKRQNADPSTARPMERTIEGKMYTMPVDDPHWQLAIPLNVMALNPLLVQNER
ncbi:MAG: RagB/SusD family nutrient uptake outer membrane protein [Prevotella sp.]|nr:RagB/SusD family nutrient uptake outer membrane protein [Prevotella sp.]